MKMLKKKKGYVM